MGVGVTGANGFLGKALLKALGDASIDVVPIKLSRHEEVLQSIYLERLVSDLDLEAVFHLAAVRNPRSNHEFKVNAQLPALLENALKRTRPNARLFHLSSINTVLSERNDSYSISKRQAEASLEKTGAIIIRPGIIWSWDMGAGGDAGRLRNYLDRSLPFHPIPFPGQLYRPVLVEKLAVWMVELLQEKDPSSVINVLGNQPVTIWALAKHMSKSTKARLLPIPTAFLEKIIPQAMLKWLPIALRSLDACVPDNTIGRSAEDVLEIPFLMPNEKF